MFFGRVGILDKNGVACLIVRCFFVVLRLAGLMGYSQSTNLIRSASDTADRRSPYGTIMPPTPEAYATFDNAKSRSAVQNVVLILMCSVGFSLLFQNITTEIGGCLERIYGTTTRPTTNEFVI